MHGPWFGNDWNIVCIVWVGCYVCDWSPEDWLDLLFHRIQAVTLNVKPFNVLSWEWLAQAWSFQRPQSVETKWVRYLCPKLQCLCMCVPVKGIHMPLFRLFSHSSPWPQLFDRKKYEPGLTNTSLFPPDWEIEGKNMGKVSLFIPHHPKTQVT